MGEHHRLSQQDRTLIEHWNGRAWKIVPSPRVGTLENDLQGVAATSADNAWAVGHHVFPGGGDRTLILHWNGTAWKVQHSPNPGDPNDFLMDVAATSASNAWAVGVQSRGGIDKTLILRWNGTAWRTSNSPKLDSKFNRLDGVTATSARNAWAVGSQYHQGIFARTLIEHWNGKAWMVQPSPNPSTDDNVLNDVDASSSSNAWSVGSYDMSGSYAFAVHCC